MNQLNVRWKYICFKNNRLGTCNNYINDLKCIKNVQPHIKFTFKEICY